MPDCIAQIFPVRNWLPPCGYSGFDAPLPAQQNQSRSFSPRYVAGKTPKHLCISYMSAIPSHLPRRTPLLRFVGKQYSKQWDFGDIPDCTTEISLS